MSQENIEEVRRAYEKFARTGQPPLSALDPDVEWRTAADLPDSGVHRGHDGVGALIQEWVDSFENFRGDATEFIDRGEYVVVSLVLRGRVRGPTRRSPSPKRTCGGCARERLSRWRTQSLAQYAWGTAPVGGL